ncbi:methylmalonyl-CoA mutase C-terminal domain-containing protein/methyltransferase cognate corrinoid proteins [Peptoclostridium litorale DSM 5388]|uniref:Dimethylamine corrinoid protein 1 n=1 Tax=Peptoclostridium litorale DSM 5388 TaxID=1121324 RepID=A0A069RFZ9_PEPLI|nr:corrinoid protein [Peptoclostridium litorale]KDR95738.1 dimethylamine corrinoid protein 1 [Peptoclostridium litorale DSM 5388]SIO22293.1 methylmalonyl-CoA mutase C-terminal domain-containing protein/methyltransferase cognate corrinoid proteins [Peptoclostridium litorale DSM 5388]
MIEKEEILRRLAECVVEMEEDEIIEVANEAIESGIDPQEAIMNGLSRGMEKVSELFESGEYFVPEVIVCADTMYSALEVLRPHQKKAADNMGKIVIGVVEGDTHDIGKNIVAIMLEAAGFEMHDLGRNVPAMDFADKAQEIGADIVCLSSLMTTTMHGMKDVIEELGKRGLEKKPFVMIGGAPISESFANEIGAHGYSANAPEAVNLAKRFMERRAGA